MAEKKTGKKFVQKPKFRNEKKYKTDKTEVKIDTLVQCMANAADVSFLTCRMSSS